MFGKNKSKGHNSETKKGGAIIHIPIKLHKDIPNGNWEMECTRMLEKINQRGIPWKLRKREQSFLSATRPLDLIHIPMKLHDGIPKDY